MATLLHATPKESRAPETEVLPDGRKRLTRFFELASKILIPPELDLPVASPDIFPAPPTGYEGLLLTYKKLTDDLPLPGKDSRPTVQLIFEQIDALEETPVGGTTERMLPDGRRGYDLDYVQFSTNDFVPGVPGTDVSPNDGEAYLLSVEGPDDGTLRQIKRTYVYGGILATETQTKNNGSLSLMTITSAKAVPATPAGYTLIGQPVQNPAGLPIFTYTFAKGNGLISTQVEFRQSKDQGANGVTITTIRYLTASSVTADPTTGPAASANIGFTFDDQDGYRVWTSLYANGAGTIFSSVETKNNGKLIVYKVTALNTAPTTPAATIGGTVVLISAVNHLGSRFESGVTIYEYTWAEGEGLVIDDKDIRAGGSLVVYHRLSLAVVPTTPSATIGGTVAVFEISTRQEDGYAVYDYRWAEGKGRSAIVTRGREDGSIIFNVIEAGAAAATPTYPGSGTGYLTELENTGDTGYYVNRATYIKLPATDTFRKQVNFRMPGLAYFIGTQLILQPPTEQFILASVAVSYDTLQDTTVPWTVKLFASFSDAYTPTGASAPITHCEGLGDYLAGGSTSSGTSSSYQGIPCDSWVYILTGSTPSGLPTGATTIHVDNDPYLTDITGAVVYRRAVTSYSF